MGVNLRAFIGIVVSATVLGTLAACAAPTGGTPPHPAGTTTVPGPVAGTTSGSASSPTVARPPDVVAVTASGSLVVLDSTSGTVLRTLYPGNVRPARVGPGSTGDAEEVAVSPDGRTVYFAVSGACQQEVESIPVGGGQAKKIDVGDVPALSPDGRELAYAREWPPNPGPACPTPTSPSVLVVRNLSAGTVRTYQLPDVLGAGHPLGINHLSWDPSGRKLAVSTAEIQDGEGMSVQIFDRDNGQPAVPDPAKPPTIPVVGGQDPDGSYYNQATFLPDGHLFTVRQCCLGWPPVTKYVDLDEIDTQGNVIHRVATGYTDRTHTSLSVDATGHWLLYISGDEIYISGNGATPAPLTSGYNAAAW